MCVSVRMEVSIAEVTATVLRVTVGHSVKWMSDTRYVSFSMRIS